MYMYMYIVDYNTCVLAVQYRELNWLPRGTVVVGGLKHACMLSLNLLLMSLSR